MSKKFDLWSPYFSKMVEGLNSYITRAFSIMQSKDTDNAKITLSIDFYMDHTEVADDRSFGGMREVVIPNIDFKIGFKTEVKTEHKDMVTGAGTELIRNQYGEYCIVSAAEAAGQMCIMDMVEEGKDE